MIYLNKIIKSVDAYESIKFDFYGSIWWTPLAVYNRYNYYFIHK